MLGNIFLKYDPKNSGRLNTIFTFPSSMEIQGYSLIMFNAHYSFKLLVIIILGFFIFINKIILIIILFIKIK